MKTSFHIANKEFAGYLKISANRNEYYFCDDVIIEYEDCKQLEFEIEFVSTEKYLKYKAQNPFLRFLINLAKYILSPLIYFIDNEDSIGLDKGYHSFSPFMLKKTFSVTEPSGKTVALEYVESKYDKITNVFSQPDIVVQNDSVSVISDNIRYSENILKQEWNTYHIPAFTVIMIFILLLNLLNISIFSKVVREIPLDIGGVIGMSFCSLVMTALLIACIVVIIKAYRLFKKINQINLYTTAESN